MSVVTMNPEPQPMDGENKSRLASVPAWGSYLYQNFVMPAFSPTASMSEWLNNNTPFGALTPRGNPSQAQQHQAQQQQHQPLDYFGGQWGKGEDSQDTSNFNMPAQSSGSTFPEFSFNPQSAPMQQNNSHSSNPLPSFQRNSDPGPSSFYPAYGNYSFDPSSIQTSLLLNQPPPRQNSLPMFYPSHDRPAQPISRNSLNAVDGQLTHTPSPIMSRSQTPQQSPRSGKRRFDSLDSTEDHDSEHDQEPDVPEGVERDGMIWGMKVEDYRALSARERKRVRNRISARTFRAKRKEHLTLLEESSSIKELKLRLANEENHRLRLEVAELRQRLARYES